MDTGIESINGNFKGKHLVSVNQLSPKDLQILFEKTDEMKKIVKTKGSTDILKGKIIACVFFEPSSRTFTSFVTAAQRVGAGFIPLLGMSATSVAKGETLEDTIRTFGCNADLIVQRHPEVGSAAYAAKYSYVPIVNAGDGKGEHPTQAILDTYTIKSHFPSFEKITYGFVGDLLNGRTVHSNTKLLSTLGAKNYVFVSPKRLKLPDEIVSFLEKKGAKVTETENLDEVIGNLDVMYDTRVQKERFEDVKEYEALKHKYIITPQTMKKAKSKMILMHPLPRVGEITNEVDSDPRAVYIREQMENGIYTRMAILALILEKV